ncbi:MAG: PilZ domain-containing protein [Burkholderiaceae bacterium]|nr:PilZ domain-containing protein [Burkholderiaceae bacterium]
MEQVISKAASSGANSQAAPALAIAGAAGASEKGGLRPSILSLTIREKSALATSYMRFIDGGGLFIPTTRPARLGDEVYAMVTVVDEESRMPIPGRVCWITPAGVPGRPQGIGVQFAKNEAGEQARSTIEKLIGAVHKADRATQTI